MKRIALAALLLLAAATASAATILQASGNSPVAFEAENNATIIPGTPTTFVTTNDVQASGGAAIYTAGTTDNTTAPHSFAVYAIKFATAGSYTLYYRWKADAARTVADQFTANSALIANGFGTFTTAGAAGAADFHTAASNGTQAPANNVFDWSQETSAYTVTAADVAAGIPLVLSIGSREAGMVIDRWVLSTDPALADAALDALANSETSIATQGGGETFLAFEAEAKAKLIAGAPTTFVVTNDATASAGAALYTAGTTDTTTAPSGFAVFSVKFATAGAYTLYYRWKADAARTVADQFTANSALIANAFGNFTTPGAAGAADFHTAAANGTQAPANNVFDWSQETSAYTVTSADVAAGIPLVLSIGTREAGMVIDRIVLSTDAALSDAALDALPNSGTKVAAPEIVKAVGSAALNKVTLTFNRALAAATVLPARFQLSGGVNVTAAALDPSDPRKVTLTTGTQVQGTVYTVSVNGVTDTSGAAVLPNTSKAFTAWKLVEGWATTEIYQNITGNSVADLTGSAAFQARTPDEVRWVKGFQLNNDPRAPNMGARLSAFFSPATSGAYNFYVNNDDEAELQLSSNQTEASLQSLGAFATSPAVFDDANVATSANLTAGQKYLLAGLLKSGGGDARLNVAAKAASSPAPAASLSVLAGSQISTFVNPDLGNVIFVQQPANTTVAAGARATFSVKVAATEQPVYYQWRVNGTNIAGAVRSTFVTPVLSAADNGKIYSVVVSVAGKDSASANATLTVSGNAAATVEPYLGLNFVGGGDNIGGALSAVDVAGAILQENWNNLTGFQFDQTALVDASGKASPVTFSATATEHWYCGTIASGDANGLLLQGYIDTGASLDPLPLTLNNVPSGTYNLIIYSLGFPFQASFEESISLVASGTYPTYHVKAETGLEFNTSPQFRRMASTSEASRAVGNYVQFDNVKPAADGSITINVAWESTAAGNGHQPAVNGIQLVKSGIIPTGPVTLSAAAGGGGSVTLSWPASALGYTLESSAKLGASAQWMAVAGTPNPIAVAGSTSVTAGAGAGAKFYRLRK